MIEFFKTQGTKPYDIGFSHGERFKDKIMASIVNYKDVFKVYAGLEWETCIDLARPFHHVIKSFDAGMIEEMEGIAEGSGVPYDEILLINCHHEIMFMNSYLAAERKRGGCTAIAVVPERTKDGHMIHGQNLDFNPGHEEFLVLLEIEQEGKPRILTVTEAGTIGKLGMNSKGVAVTGTAIETPGVPLGLPTNAVLRKILNSKNLSDAIYVISSHPCACAYTYTISINDGEVVNVEVVPEDYEVLYPEDGLCVHTNHYISQRLLAKHPDMMRIVCTNTQIRYGRARRLLNGLDRPITIDDFKMIFTDHANFPESICWHPDTRIKNVSAQVKDACSLIMDTTAGILLLAKGNPCENEYVQYEMQMDNKPMKPIAWSNV